MPERLPLPTFKIEVQSGDSRFCSLECQFFKSGSCVLADRQIFMSAINRNFCRSQLCLKIFGG